MPVSKLYFEDFKPGLFAEYGPRTISREEFLAFCDQVETVPEEGLVERFNLPAVEAETLLPALLVYRAVLSETSARRFVVSDASLRTTARRSWPSAASHPGSCSSRRRASR